MSPYITTISCHVALQRFVTVSWARSHWQLAVELLARRPATCHHGIDIIAQTPRNTVVMQRDMQHKATWCDNIMIPHPSACFASTGWTETWDVVSCSCALHLPWMQALALLETMAKKAWWVLGEVFPSKLLIATLWSTSFISFPLKFTTFFVDFWSKTARSFAVTWCAAAAPLVASVVNVDGNTLCSSCSKCSSLAATGDFPYSPTCPSCSTWFKICFSVPLLFLKKLYSTILLPELLLLPFEFEGVFSQANTPNGLRMSQTTFGRDKLQRTR